MAAEPDLSEFYALSVGRPRSCRVRSALDLLDDKQRVQLEAAMVSDRVTTTAILLWLKKRGAEQMSVETVRRHRRGDCSCKSDD